MLKVLFLFLDEKPLVGKIFDCFSHMSMNRTLHLLTEVDILPPCLDHWSMNKLLLAISVIPPVTPLYSIGIQSFLENLIWKSFGYRSVAVVVPLPDTAIVVLNVTSLSLRTTKRFVFARFLKLSYTFVSSISVVDAPVPLHCLSQTSMTLIVS